MAEASAREAVRGADVVITMLPTVEVVGSVIFDGAVADDFAPGCVWARWAPSVWRRPSPPVTGSLPAGPMWCSSTRRYRAARARPSEAGFSSWRLGPPTHEKRDL